MMGHREKRFHRAMLYDDGAWWYAKFSMHKMEKYAAKDYKKTTIRLSRQKTKLELLEVTV